MKVVSIESLKDVSGGQPESNFLDNIPPQSQPGVDIAVVGNGSNLTYDAQANFPAGENTQVGVGIGGNNHHPVQDVRIEIHHKF